MMSLPRNTTGEISNEKSNGDGNDWGGTLMSNALGRIASTPASNPAMPMVTTVRISRGAAKNRRMKTNSTSAPSATATSKAIGIATKYGKPGPTMSRTPSAAGAPPRSPVAKLTMRLERYVSASPNASRAVSAPITMP